MNKEVKIKEKTAEGAMKGEYYRIISYSSKRIIHLHSLHILYCNIYIPRSTHSASSSWIETINNNIYFVQRDSS